MSLKIASLAAKKSSTEGEPYEWKERTQSNNGPIKLSKNWFLIMYENQGGIHRKSKNLSQDYVTWDHPLYHCTVASASRQVLVSTGWINWWPERIASGVKQGFLDHMGKCCNNSPNIPIAFPVTAIVCTRSRVGIEGDRLWVSSLRSCVVWDLMQQSIGSDCA